MNEVDVSRVSSRIALKISHYYFLVLATKYGAFISCLHKSRIVKVIPTCLPERAKSPNRRITDESFLS